MLQITKSSIAKLHDELKRLEEIELPKNTKELKTAIDMGDGLHDNVMWQLADRKFKATFQKINEIKTLLRKSSIKEETTHKIKKVQIGTKVTFEINGKSRTVEIVNDFEIDPKRNRISAQSPIGNALMNKKVGDEFELNGKRGKVTKIDTNSSGPSDN